MDSATKEKPRSKEEWGLNDNPGDVLLSRAVSSSVPSALGGLTAVFGMGTGVTPPASSPEVQNHNREGFSPEASHKMADLYDQFQY